jgi:hypothetical protein
MPLNEPFHVEFDEDRLHGSDRQICLPGDLVG